MREEFMIERHGKRYVLYAGLLEEAHERGLRSIKTELLCPPWENDEGVAVVKAEVSMDDDENVHEGRIFEGIGDASPENVGRAIAPHLIRMAETRAKARALRDAINVGVTAFEELGGHESDEDGAGGPARTSSGSRQGKGDRERTTQPRSSGGSSGSGSSSGGDGPTKKQLDYLKRLIEDKGEMSDFIDKYGPPHEMTKREVSEWIEKLR